MLLQCCLTEMCIENFFMTNSQGSLINTSNSQGRSQNFWFGGGGASFDWSLSQHFSKWKKQFINFCATNLAKNICPSPKGLMGFISFRALYFYLGGSLAPPSPYLATSMPPPPTTARLLHTVALCYHRNDAPHRSASAVCRYRHRMYRNKQIKGVAKAN